jgi:hypothetical protein
VYVRGVVKPKTVPTTDELHERIRQSIRVHSFDADGAVERYFDYVQHANGLHIVVLACDIRKSTYLMKEANSAAAFARIMSNFVYYAREFVRISSSKGDCGEISLNPPTDLRVGGLMAPLHAHRG